MLDRVLDRLTTQVDAIIISANRNLASYHRRGYPVCRDIDTPLPGPLAGVASSVALCTTPRLQLCPGDTPDLPLDLVSRLSLPGVAYPTDGDRPHFLHAQLDSEHASSLEDGDAPTSVRAWLKQLNAIEIDFSDQRRAFLNVNAPADLAAARDQLT